MARLPGSSRGSGRLPPPPSGAAGQDDGGGGRRRGSGSRAASPPPAAAAAAALRAPRAGRALLRAPPGAGPPRGDRRARGPGASARAPCPWGPGAGAPRGRGGGRPVCTPRGLGPDRAPETAGAAALSGLGLGLRGSAAGHVPTPDRGRFLPARGPPGRRKACRARMHLSPEWSIYLDPTCAVERAMAWECPAKLSSPPAKPDLTLQALSAKPSALQGRWPSLGVHPEQLPLVPRPSSREPLAA
ncbi:hypothetical protein R6Z07F_017573 [Ovis aries]